MADDQLAPLLAPQRVFTRTEVLTRPCPVPAEPRVYAWYFDEVPPGVPVEGCHVDPTAGCLLYVGISPKPPSRDGASVSKSNLRTRVRYHFQGNAEGSTLRLTLGCLLAEPLGIGLRRVGSGSRLTFSAGETVLSEWMSRHARVCWLVTPAPWEVESRLIGELALPLNLDQNSRSSFWEWLSRVRSDQRALARSLPVLPR